MIKWLYCEARNSAGMPVFKMPVCSDEEALDSFIEANKGSELFISVATFDSDRLENIVEVPLCFVLKGPDQEKLRETAAGVIEYLKKHLEIPSSCVVVQWNTLDTMVVLVPSMVFEDPSPRYFRLWNYRVARDMVRAGIKDIDLDVYHRTSVVPLVRSLHPTTNKYVIAFGTDDLLTNDMPRLLDLSGSPCPERNMVVPFRTPQAAQIASHELETTGSFCAVQSRLQSKLLEDGWFWPQCIRRLEACNLGPIANLEACRIAAQFLALIKGGKANIFDHLRSIDRNTGGKNDMRLAAITEFALDYPQFAGCDHLMMKSSVPIVSVLSKNLLMKLRNQSFSMIFSCSFYSFKIG